MKTRAVSIVIGLVLLASCSEERRMVRRGALQCERQIELTKVAELELLTQLDAIGRKFALNSTRDSVTEEVFAEEFGWRPAIYYLSRSEDKEDVLVLAAANVTARNRMFVKVYGGDKDETLAKQVCVSIQSLH